MTSKTPDDIRGLEYDWLAADVDGRVRSGEPDLPNSIDGFAALLM